MMQTNTEARRESEKCRCGSVKSMFGANDGESDMMVYGPARSVGNVDCYHTPVGRY